MSADDHIHDAKTSCEIVGAAISVWKQLSTDGGGAGATLTPDSFAIAGNFSPGDLRAAVTLSFPRVPPGVFLDWLGARLVVWPAGVVNDRRTAIVSSRLGKRRDLKRAWFDALRTSVVRQGQAECLCCADGTAAAEAVIRASELFGATRLRIEVDSAGCVSKEELIRWLEVKVWRQQSSESPLEHVAYVSPAYQPDITRQVCDAAMNRRPPVQDTALVLAAERIAALSCRAGGHTESLLQRHLQDRNRSAPVLLATVPEARGDGVSQALVDQGAVPWMLERADGSITGIKDRRVFGSRAGPMDADYSDSDRTLMADGPLQFPDEWLCHWTRPRQGPWAEQPEQEFLDELVLGCQTADRSAYAALLRIVQQRQIIATRSVRKAAKTVSFTAVPLGEFRNRRVYRKHKQRFDFEPWGIAVRKSALIKVSCRPVIYVERDTYNDMTQDGRLYLQPKSDEGHRIDWSQECEWRCSGDLDLSRFNPEDIFAFVDTHQEATGLSAVAPWPVVQLPPMTKPV